MSSYVKFEFKFFPLATWEEFKLRIRRHFEINETYTATLARVSVFGEYINLIMINLCRGRSLMQSLSLSEKEKIEFLADGVRDPILKKMILSIVFFNIGFFTL